MLRLNLPRLVRPGGIHPGLHNAKASLLPYQPWPYDTRYCGLTAGEVINKFKTTSFPLHAFPQSLLTVKVEEIYGRSLDGQIDAKKGMVLLKEPRYHNDTLQKQ
jgi:hypothetical protein